MRFEAGAEYGLAVGTNGPFNVYASRACRQTLGRVTGRTGKVPARMVIHSASRVILAHLYDAWFLIDPKAYFQWQADDECCQKGYTSTEIELQFTERKV